MSRLFTKIKNGQNPETIKGSLKKSQTGQTLIETLAAVFVLIMGITAAIGLAIYAFSTSSNITRQIVAIGLAREGIEAIRNMRDTNWLKSSLDTDCYNFASSTADNASCYTEWLNPSGGFNYDLSPPSLEKSYRIKINSQNIVDPQTALYWDTQVANSKFGLNFIPDINSPNFIGYYVPETVEVYGNSDYYRKVTLNIDNENKAFPYDQDTIGPRLHVISQVWWIDKKCPRHPDWQNDGKCSIQLETNLTNWRNY